MTQGPPQDHVAQQIEAETVAFHHFVAFSLQRYQWLASAPRHYQNLLLRDIHRERQAERLRRENVRLWAEAEQHATALNAVYSERAHLVAALSKLFPASIEQHQPAEGEDWDPFWLNVVFVDLPTGQVSWHVALTDLYLFAHLPRDAGRQWDGHTTPEKYARLDALP